MIKEVIMYTVICDNCGKDCNADSEYSCWGDVSSAHDSAIDSDWTFDEDKEDVYYCPECFTYDENDNLIIKQLTPKTI